MLSLSPRTACGGTLPPGFRIRTRTRKTFRELYRDHTSGATLSGRVPGTGVFMINADKLSASNL